MYTRKPAQAHGWLCFLLSLVPAVLHAVKGIVSSAVAMDVCALTRLTGDESSPKPAGLRWACGAAGV